MKKTLPILLCVLLLLCLLPAPARAVDDSRCYEFHLTVDGVEELESEPGRVVTVSLALDRTDSESAATIYGVQAELWYDDSFFELVPDSVMTYMGVDDTDMARRTGGRAFYLTYVSFSGGDTWPAHVILGSFQLRVIGTSGVSHIFPQHCMVPTKDGRDAYASSANSATVILSTDCAVSFRSNGGSEVPGMTVQYGERIPRPADPTREGYTFAGWFADLDRTIPWDFETDTVQGNMTLYAGWTEGEPEAPAAGGFWRSVTEGPVATWTAITAAALAIMLVLLLILLLKRRKKDEDEEKKE